MKRLILARCLVYGSLFLCATTLTVIGRVNQPKQTPVMPLRHIRIAEEMGTASVTKKTPANWHENAPALEKHTDVHLSDVTLAQSVAQLAHLTHLNLACYDAHGTAHLSLHISNVPTWQAMDALAHACNGSWHRDGDLFTLQVADL